MTVFLRKGQLNYFRKKARSTPNEVIAVIAGTYDKATKTAHVFRFYYPTPIVATPNEVSISDEDVEQIEIEADRKGWSVLGSVHSHPDCLPILSDADYALFTDYKDLLVGICEVERQCRTRVVFWQRSTPLACDIGYF